MSNETIRDYISYAINIVDPYSEDQYTISKPDDPNVLLMIHTYRPDYYSSETRSNVYRITVEKVT